jgi:hypothetical protein
MPAVAKVASKPELIDESSPYPVCAAAAVIKTLIEIRAGYAISVSLRRSAGT